MTARPQESRSHAPHEIAIVGSDMLLAALPARPIQLSHALLASGFSLVVPASWGDELLAEHAVRQVLSVDARPRIYCACPRIRHRLLAAGDELAPHLLALIPPPVAAARYLRNAWPTETLRIVYIGTCEGADDPSIDERVTPTEMLARLDARGIIPARLPTTFRDVVPPDRRRYWSLPGGCPSPEALAEHAGDRQLRPIGRDGYTQELVEGLLSGQPLLLDLGETFGCACAGRVEVHGVAATREEVVALEPPRAPLPVLDSDIVVDVDYRPRLVLTRATNVRHPVLPDLIAPGPSGAPPPPSDAAPVSPPLPAFEPPSAYSNDSQPVAWPPATVPPSRALRRAMAVTPPGVAVTASREGRQPPPQPFLGGERHDGRAAVAAPRAASLSPAHGLHRVARTRASLRVTRDHGATVPRAFAALRRSGANNAIDAATPPPPAEPDTTTPGEIEEQTTPIEAVTHAPEQVDVEIVVQGDEPRAVEVEQSAPVDVDAATPEPEDIATPAEVESHAAVEVVEEAPVEAAPVQALMQPPVVEAPTIIVEPAPTAPPPVEPLSAPVQSPLSPGHAARLRTPKLTPIPPPPPPQPRRLRGMFATAALLLALIALVVAVFGF
ncbi:MAG: hypothetical protein JNL26_08990 [Gemmatimonadetes bacterium]|nr:hypothetical protein [Gemmatimonadota bacterium]